MGEDEKEKGGQQHEGHESRREATWGKEEANGVAEEVSEGRRPTKKKNVSKCHMEIPPLRAQGSLWKRRWEG